MLKKFVKAYAPEDLRNLIFAVNKHRQCHGEFPRLLRPKTFNEKILRRKVFERRPIFTTFADKYAVRDYVARRVGAQILPELHWLTEDPGNIPFDALPRSFVVKPTHGSGWVRVVRDKFTLNRDELVRTCREWLAADFYELLREREYKNIPRRIMVEEFIDDGSGEAPCDYKFFTFGGKVELIQIDVGRFGQHRRALYDTAWRDTGIKSRRERILEPVPRPKHLDSMLEIAASLGKEVAFVRVDLYDNGSKVYFGELTSTPGCGTQPFEPRSIDAQLGALWV